MSKVTPEQEELISGLNPDVQELVRAEIAKDEWEILVNITSESPDRCVLRLLEKRSVSTKYEDTNDRDQSGVKVMKLHDTPVGKPKMYDVSIP